MNGMALEHAATTAVEDNPPETLARRLMSFRCRCNVSGRLGLSCGRTPRGGRLLRAAWTASHRGRTASRDSDAMLIARRPV